MEKRRKVTAIRSFPKSLTQFDKSILEKGHEDIDKREIASIKSDVVVVEKLVYCENNVTSCGDLAMKVESVERKDGEQVAQIETIDECGSIEHLDTMKVVDTLKWNVLKTRECESKPKRRKVSSLRDFPKDLKSYEVVEQKSQEDCAVEYSDAKEDHVKEINDRVVDAFSCGEKFEKQEPVVTVDLEAILQTDVDLELHDGALKDEETITEFECGEHDNNRVENVSLVESASEDAESIQLLNELCTPVVYPCRFPKRPKVSAVRDFPDALKILKAHNEASAKILSHRAADELAGKNEITRDSQNHVEHIETEIESRESSASSEKCLSRNLKTLLTPKEETVNIDEQELSNGGANSIVLSARNTSEVTNSNKRIEGKEVGVKCINKTIVQDSMAIPRCPSKPSQCYRSDTKTNQDKGKDEVLKRKQNEGSAPMTVVLALMAPTKCRH